MKDAVRVWAAGGFAAGHEAIAAAVDILHARNGRDRPCHAKREEKRNGGENAAAQ